MGYLIKAPLGLGLFIGGIVLFNVKLVSLLETGTCASGTNTPYQVVQKCPSGTGSDILLLIAGIFAGLIGAWMFGFRGDPPWSRNGGGSRFGNVSFGLLAWGLFFTGTGATSLIASLSDQAIQDSSGGKLGGIIVGGTFLVMGVPALLIALGGLLKGLRGRDERPSGLSASGGISSGGAMSRMSAGLDSARAAQGLAGRLPWGSTPQSAGGGGTSAQIAKLERLQKLRESGALTDTEFEREKAKVLAEG
jgi:hypothetical protein